MYRQGRAHALDLRQRAAALTGTEIIDQEKDVPVFVAGKNYTDWPVGSPVADGGQVWQLLQPYDSAAHPGQPADLRALWGLCHTKNPAMAKPWVSPMVRPACTWPGSATGGRRARCTAAWRIIPYMTPKIFRRCGRRCNHDHIAATAPAGLPGL